MTRLRIGVVGCGVAGMAAASLLARDGWDVTVLERFERAQPVGAGLLLQPTGLAALAALGLRERIEAHGARVLALDGRTQDGRPVLELVYRRWSPQAYGLGVHRAALFDALYDTLFDSLCDRPARLVFGVEACGVHEGVRASVIDRRGGRHGPFDLVLAADGAHSSLREALGWGGQAQLYPWGALWTTRDDPHERWAGALRQVYDGPRRMMGVLPIGRPPGAEAPQAALFWSIARADMPAWGAMGPQAQAAAMARLWPAGAELAASGAAPFAAASYRDVAVRRWRRGRVLLIGDAAHGTSPQLGQGANLALADAVALAAALRATPNDLDAALKAYRRMRRALTAWVQLVSRALTPAFQSELGWLGLARDLFLHRLGRLAPVERLMLATLVGAGRMPAWDLTPPASRAGRLGLDQRSAVRWDGGGRPGLAGPTAPAPPPPGPSRR